MRNKKAFTLIELIAVLVILAILALIVTPIAMNIISKAKDSANKRSIDACGRSIELAIASHLIETGNFPTSIDELTIEYSGDEVVCETQELKSDSTVYLANCKVGGKTVEGYTYGKSSGSDSETTVYTAYQVGDHVSYNNITYYVIEDSDTTNDTVKLLKEEPLTKAEIDELNLNGVDYSDGYGGTGIHFGSSTDYLTSIVKQVVDAWKNSAVSSGDSVAARLITYDELIDNLGYDHANLNGSSLEMNSEYTPSWVYGYGYWTMSSSADSMWVMFSNGSLSSGASPSYNRLDVRPVLELNKSAEITKLD